MDDHPVIPWLTPAMEASPEGLADDARNDR